MASLGADQELSKLRLERQRLDAKGAELDARLAVVQRCGAPPVPPGAPEVTREELRRTAEAAAFATEEALRQGLHRVVRAGAPLAAKASKIRGRVDGGVRGVASRAESLALERGAAFAQRILDVLEIHTPPAEAVRWLRGETTTGGGGGGGPLVGPALPPLPLIIAGLAAPLRLRMLVSWNYLQLSLAVPLLLAVAGAATYDAGRPCGGGHLWAWTSGMVGILGATVVARMAVLSSAAGVMGELLDGKAPRELDSDESFAVTVKRRLLESTDDFFRALFGYDRVANSCPSGFLSMLHLAHVAWGAVGAFWNIWYVVPDSTDCHAAVLRVVAHVYALVYVMMLSWTIPLLMVWATNHMLMYTCASNAVLRRARRFDEVFPVGIPLATLLVRTFVLRRVAQICESEYHDLHANVDELKLQKAELRRKSAALSSELEEKRGQLRRAAAETREIGSKALSAPPWDRQVPAAAPAASEVLQQARDSARDAAKAILVHLHEMGVDVGDLVQQARAR